MHHRFHNAVAYTWNIHTFTSLHRGTVAFLISDNKTNSQDGRLLFEGSWSDNYHGNSRSTVGKSRERHASQALNFILLCCRALVPPLQYQYVRCVPYPKSKRRQILPPCTCIRFSMLNFLTIASRPKARSREPRRSSPPEDSSSNKSFTDIYRLGKQVRSHMLMQFCSCPCVAPSWICMPVKPLYLTNCPPPAFYYYHS
jgi:hypothetical protein